MNRNLKNLNEEKHIGQTKLDNVIFGLINNHLFEIAIVILVAISIVIRIFFAPITTCSADYDTYYKVWVETYREVGFVKGMSMTIGDYYTPLNLIYALTAITPWEPWVLLTIIPCVFEYISVYYIYKLMTFLFPQRDKKIMILASLLCLFLPAMMWNSSLWKQCDSIYVCFMVISLYYMLKDRYTVSFIFLGISFAVKLQAIFLIPLYIIIYLTRKSYSIIQFMWIPIIYFIAGLPSVICHRGLRATYLTYLLQTQEGTTEEYGMTANFPNIYYFGLDDHYSQLAIPAIVITVSIFAGIALVSFIYKDKFLNKILTFYLGIWSTWTLMIFLPGMHERYDLIVVLLITAFMIAYYHRLFGIVVVLNLCNIVMYSNAIFEFGTVPRVVVSIIYVAAYLLVSVDFFKNALRGNSLEINSRKIC